MAGSGEVEVQVYEVAGKAFATPVAESSDGTGVEVKISDAKLWSPEEPNLYKFTAKYGKDMMDAFQAVPSVVMWVPYNEGWGQCGEFLTHSTLDFVKRYDPTRLVNGPSGCWDWEGGQLMPKGWAWKNRVETAHKPVDVCETADTVDMHLYRHDNPDGIYASHKVFAANDRRISFLGEFGGLGHPVEGHLWRTAKGWQRRISR